MRPAMPGWNHDVPGKNVRLMSVGHVFGTDAENRKIQFICQPGTPGIIDVDDGTGRAAGCPADKRTQKIGEKPLFAVIIRVHVRVIIQVILGQVGEIPMSKWHPSTRNWSRPWEDTSMMTWVMPACFIVARVFWIASASGVVVGAFSRVPL